MPGVQKLREMRTHMQRICVSFPLHSRFAAADLYKLDPITLVWTSLLTSGPTPSPRGYMGFTATLNGLIYVFGGVGGGEQIG
jgi:hypothetical protein